MWHCSSLSSTYMPVCTSMCVRSRSATSCDRFKVKDVKFSYHVEDVFNIDIPALQHGNDGLIYTCVNTPYAPGTDKNMYASASVCGPASLIGCFQFKVEAAFRKLDRLQTCAQVSADTWEGCHARLPD